MEQKAWARTESGLFSGYFAGLFLGNLVIGLGARVFASRGGTIVAAGKRINHSCETLCSQGLCAQMRNINYKLIFKF